MKNLVRFWKGITRDAYDALETKDPSTLYFTSDTHEIILEELSYGSSDLFNVSEDSGGSIVFSIVEGKLVASAVLDPEDNSIQVNPDGLFVPPAGIAIPENLVEGHFIYAKADGEVKDSGISFTTKISASSTDTEVPSSAAVYEALLRVAPMWESIETAEDLIAWQRHNWKDFKEKIQVSSPFSLLPNSFFKCDGYEVRFSLKFEFSEAMESEELFYSVATFPRYLSPANRVVFFSAITDNTSSAIENTVAIFEDR
ncbi:MAG: hypothetical protein LBC41_07425, partial [Clostridiales bacterium]|nr:hypothetical protein [Clostridiales bacterium]